MSNVLLLRTASQDTLDRYEDAFRSRGYHPISVSVLETIIVGRKELASKLRLGAAKQSLSGVIITSKRAVEAWFEAAQALHAAGNSSDSEWWSVPFYVVGEATSVALHRLCERFPPHSPKDIRGGSETGTAERLAEFILKDLPSDGISRTLLYLTGDKNRDTLPRILESGSVALDPLQVYATQGEGISWGWIIYFAPSVAEFVTPILWNHFVLPTITPNKNDIGESPERNIVKVAAIGPTTRSYLLQTLKLSVAVTARNPNAEDIADAIIQYDGAQ